MRSGITRRWLRGDQQRGHNNSQGNVFQFRHDLSLSHYQKQHLAHAQISHVFSLSHNAYLVRVLVFH